MSYSTALGVTLNARPVHLAEFRNAWGWCPSIWRRLLSFHGYSEHSIALDDDAGLRALWQSIETLPEWQQAPLVLTFDTGVIPRQAFGWAAKQLEAFDSRLPAPPGHVNHVPPMAALLRTQPEFPLFGVWGTSVTQNPFDPWDEESDDHGSGIALSETYVLERHRDMLTETATPQALRETT